MAEDKVAGGAVDESPPVTSSRAGSRARTWCSADRHRTSYRGRRQHSPQDLDVEDKTP